MQVFINDRPVPAAVPGGATIGEMIEALDVHVAPGEIVTEVAVDGEPFSAGDDTAWARRPLAGIARLALTTRSVPALASELREEVRNALACIAAKLDTAAARLDASEPKQAQALLAVALDELRLTLVLDQETARLDGAPLVASQETLMPVADELLAAQQRLDLRRLRLLVGERLAPLLRAWSAGVPPGCGP
jgi:hypothetical protein